MTSNPTKSANARIKPSAKTKFHIDYSWWEREDRDLRSYLISQLPPEKRTHIDSGQADDTMDYIDPHTAEVRKIDALQRALTEAANSGTWISDHTTLVDAVFRAFIANHNHPLSPDELSAIINRPSATILRTLAGGTVYKGLRPVNE